MTGRVGLFQCEWNLRNNAAHPGAALIAGDLARAGFEVVKAIVDVSRLDDLAAFVRSERLRLVALDAVFPVAAVRRLRELLPDVVLVAGGMNAFAVLRKAPLDYAIVGPGRRAMVELAGRVLSGRDVAGVPNLFFRRREGGEEIIGHTGVVEPWRLAAEVTPFEPDYDWTYIGGPREPGANTAFLSVHPELGCYYMRPVARNALYEGLRLRVPPGRYDEAARRVVETDLLPRSGGCSFCIFRYQSYETGAPGDVAAEALRQARYLVRRFGVRTIALQSENPFPFLLPWLEGVAAELRGIEEIHIRSTVQALLRHEETLRKSVVTARAAGIRLALVGIGFESFVQESLDLLNKGVTVEDNVRALGILRAVKQEAGEACETMHGHGMIFFTPLTTLEDVRTNLAMTRRHAPEMLRLMSFGSRLTLYSEIQPLFQLLEGMGLVVPSDEEFGFSFRFRDPRVEDFLAGWRWLRDVLLARALPAGAALPRPVRTTLELRTFEEALDAGLSNLPDRVAFRSDLCRRMPALAREIAGTLAAPPVEDPFIAGPRQFEGDRRG